MNKVIVRFGGWFLGLSIASVALVGCKSEYEKRYDMAKQMTKEGKIEEAVQWYMQAAEANPKAPKPWFRAAKLLKKIDQHTTAARYCEKALELDPEYVDVYPELVKELGRAGEYDRGLEVANEALKKNIVKRDLAITGEIKEQMAEIERLKKAEESGQWTPGQPIPPPLPDVPTTATKPATP